jgi:hypothetical protein
MRPQNPNRHRIEDFNSAETLSGEMAPQSRQETNAGRLWTLTQDASRPSATPWEKNWATRSSRQFVQTPPTTGKGNPLAFTRRKRLGPPEIAE